MDAARLLRRLAVLQGVYYLVTAVWPLVHMPSFLAVTGPKVDLWLVRTVAILIGAIGGAVLLGGLRGAVMAELRLLAVASAAGLAWIDVYYAGIGRIWPVYLLDAVAEVGLVAAWLVLTFLEKKRPPQR